MSCTGRVVACWFSFVLPPPVSVDIPCESSGLPHDLSGQVLVYGPQLVEPTAAEAEALIEGLLTEAAESATYWESCVGCSEGEAGCLKTVHTDGGAVEDWDYIIGQRPSGGWFVVLFTNSQMSAWTCCSACAEPL